MVAAPLSLNSLSVSALYAVFPRSNGRVPLKLPAEMVVKSPDFAIEWSRPIEAKQPSDGLDKGDKFPRSNGRGPIEAINDRQKKRLPIGFRDRMVAAPLKPLPLDYGIAFFLFPRSNGRGPIEAASSRFHLLLLQGVSAIEWSRPH